MAIRETIRAWLRPAVVFSFGYDGFVSYCRRDAAVYASAMQAKLESAGLTICLDKRDLNPGAVLIKAIERAIESAPYFILLESPEAIRSRYVREELNTAVKTDRQIIRVTFPMIADRAPVRAFWLQPHSAFLAQRIWLDEKDVEPLRDVPSHDVLVDIIRTHITRRKRRRFLRWAAGLSTAFLFAVGLIAVAWFATKRANDAIDGFRDPDVPLGEAFRSAADVLGADLFPLYDLFAGSQHWQLRNLENVTFVKPRSRIAETTPCTAADRRAPCSSHEATLHVERVNDKLQATSRTMAGVFPLGDAGNYQGSAATKTTVAIAKTDGVSLWRIVSEDRFLLEEFAHVDLGNVYYDLAFSNDGEYLYVLNQASGETGTRLSVVSASGHELQSVPLPASTKNASTDPDCRDSPDSVTVLEGALKICSSRTAFGFDVANVIPPTPYPLNRQSREGGVAGGGLGPGKAIGYWIGADAQMVYVCAPACSLTKNEAEVHDIVGKSKILSLTITPRQSDGSYSVTISAGGQTDASDGSRVLATAGDGTRIKIDGSGHVVVQYANGGTRAPYGEPFVRPGMKVTGAALTPSGSVAVVALVTDRGSLLAVGTRSFWRDMAWHLLETSGPVLAVRISDDGAEVDALEHWKTALVTRTYLLSRH